MLLLLALDFPPNLFQKRQMPCPWEGSMAVVVVVVAVEVVGTVQVKGDIKGNFLR